MVVLTWEREISTCPHHIPALALNKTRLLSELNLWFTLFKKLTTSARIFFFLISKIQGTGECGAASLSRPNVKQHEVFQEFKMSLLNYLAQKLQKVTRPREKVGVPDDWASALTLHHCMVTRRNNSVPILQERIDLIWLNPAFLLTHGPNKGNSWRGRICDQTQLIYSAELCVREETPLLQGPTVKVVFLILCFYQLGLSWFHKENQRLTFAKASKVLAIIVVL